MRVVEWVVMGGWCAGECGMGGGVVGDGVFAG